MREIQPVDWAVVLDVMDRKFESNESRPEVIFDFTDGEIGLKFEPAQFWIWVQKLHDVKSFEADAFFRPDLPLILEVDDNRAYVLNVVVGSHELPVCFSWFNVESVELRFFQLWKTCIPFFISNP